MPLFQKHAYSNSFLSSTCHFCPYQPLSFSLNIVLPLIRVLFQSSRLRQQFFLNACQNSLMERAYILCSTAEMPVTPTPSKNPSRCEDPL